MTVDTSQIDWVIDYTKRRISDTREVIRQEQNSLAELEKNLNEFEIAKIRIEQGGDI